MSYSWPLPAWTRERINEKNGVVSLRSQKVEREAFGFLINISVSLVTVNMALNLSNQPKSEIASL